MPFTFIRTVSFNLHTHSQDAFYDNLSSPATILIDKELRLRELSSGPRLTCLADGELGSEPGVLLEHMLFTLMPWSSHRHNSEHVSILILAEVSLLFQREAKLFSKKSQPSRLGASATS